MTSFSQKFNPRANVFIMVNLGCEMLFVIDQRLKAQQIAVEKSIQVIHDVTAVLLEPKFIDSLIVGSTQSNAQLLTEEHCKFMLKDIATCSLMRLDDISMDKLWNLMTMIYKWQLYQAQQQYHLMDITFRHLQAIGNLYPDEKRAMLVDFTKNTLLDFWNSCNDDEQLSVYRTNKAWLECFNTKISLLIRLGFQALDGSFIEEVDQPYYKDFQYSIGENIYMKSAEIAELKKQELEERSVTTSAKCVNQLAEMLNYSQSSAATSDSASEEFKPINVVDFQKQFEQNLQQCNILFEDLDVNGIRNKTTTTDSSSEFIRLDTVYNRQPETSSAATAHSSNHHVDASNQGVGGTVINKELLNLYSKLN